MSSRDRPDGTSAPLAELIKQMSKNMPEEEEEDFMAVNVPELPAYYQHNSFGAVPLMTKNSVMEIQQNMQNYYDDPMVDSPPRPLKRTTSLKRETSINFTLDAF